MKLRFSARANSTLGTADSWPLEEDDYFPDVLREAVLDAMDINIDVTISGVTMHLAAWLDTDHWESDWVEKLGCAHDEVEERVAALLQEAIEVD